MPARVDGLGALFAAAELENDDEHDEEMQDERVDSGGKYYAPGASFMLWKRGPRRDHRPPGPLPSLSAHAAR